MGLVPTARTDELHAYTTRGYGKPGAGNGKWFMSQPQEILDRLKALYQEDPCPSKERMDAIAKELGAPSTSAVNTYFQSMELWAAEVHSTF